MSSTEQTIDQMRGLRLTGAVEEYELIRSNPSLRPDSQDELIARLVQSQIDWKERKRLERAFKAAKLRVPNACFEDIDYRSSRGIDRDLISSLGTNDYIKKSINIIFTGATGTGKTYMACALANQAIRAGYSVWYKRMDRLMEEIMLAHANGSLPKLRAKIAKLDALMLDDWGISPISANARIHLLDVIEQLSGAGSLIITSQLPIAGWHEYLGEQTIADAILDRVVHRAHKIELKGESMRKLKESM